MLGLRIHQLLDTRGEPAIQIFCLRNRLVGGRGHFVARLAFALQFSSNPLDLEVLRRFQCLDLTLAKDTVEEPAHHCADDRNRKQTKEYFAD